MAQVTVIAGGHVPERGPQGTHTCPVPTVPAGQTQVVCLSTTHSVQPALSGSGWQALLSSTADAAPSRQWTFVRAGPQSAGTVQITYGGATPITVGCGFGVTGAPLAHGSNAASQSSTSDAVPPAPTVATVAESLVIAFASSGMWPRQFQTPGGATAILPSAVANPPQDWSYTQLGGIGARVVSYVVNAVNAAWQPPQWVATDPDGGATSDYWRLQTVAFRPAVIAVTDPTITVDATVGFMPAPVMVAGPLSPTEIEVGFNVQDMPDAAGITGFEVFLTNQGLDFRSRLQTITPSNNAGYAKYSGLEPGMGYIASVRSVRAAGGQYTVTSRSAMTEQTVRTGPPPGVIAEVAVSPVSATTAMLSWDFPAYAGVSVDIWVGPVGGAMARAVTVLSGESSYLIRSLHPDTDYHVQLRPAYGDTFGPFTDPVAFRTPADPTAPPPGPGPAPPPAPPADLRLSERVKRNLRLIHHR